MSVRNGGRRKRKQLNVSSWRMDTDVLIGLKRVKDAGGLARTEYINNCLRTFLFTDKFLKKSELKKIEALSE